MGRLGDGHPFARAFLGTGVLGGFTTYSAFAVQTALLLGAAPVAGVALAVGSRCCSAPGGRARVRLTQRPPRHGSGGVAGARGDLVSAWVLLAAAAAGGVGAGLRYIVDVLVVGGQARRGSRSASWS